MIVLGIESSCDETAAAVVKDGHTLLSNVVATSMDLHAAFGGVVPEIAARSHVESIIPVIEKALEQAFSDESTKYETTNVKQITNSKSKTQNKALPKSKISNPDSFDPWDNIDAIAVTYGAGLGGSLLVGVMSARTLAITKKKPLYAINHVEGHVYANFITSVGVNPKSEIRNPKKTLKSATWQLADQTYQLPTTQPEFPALALIVSGGHSQLVLFRNHFDYTLLGQTRDDAIGEAFDKVAKITGLPYPGGPSVAIAALKGDPYKYKLPKARLEPDKRILDIRRKILGSSSQISNLKSNISYDFSFSGIKTAVLRLAQQEIGEDFTFPSHQLPDRLSEAQKNDIAASFQRVAVETVVDKTVLAFDEFKPKSVIIAGGVAANQELRRQLSDRIPIDIEYTDIKLCTDNGAMIATLGCYKAMLGAETADPYTLQIQPNLSM